MKPLKLYTADSHVGHKNIVHYAQRPFHDVNEMNAAILARLREAEATGAEIYHAGDLCFDLFHFLQKCGPIFQSPEGKAIVPGNHDRLCKPALREAYASEFGTIVGTEKDWAVHSLMTTDVLDGHPVTVLVSHKPQENLWGADINVFGHVHNNVLFRDASHHPEDDWSFESDRHVCACVELHDFRPVTLQALADEKRAGYPKAYAAVARYRELHPNPPSESELRGTKAKQQPSGTQ